MSVPPEPPMRLVTTTIPIGVLAALAQGQFAELVKAVVDVDRAVMVIGGELHSDEEAYLIDTGSVQANLWGINLYPDTYPDPDWLEYDSMINLRPSHGNRTRSVDDPTARARIAAIVAQLVDPDA